MKILNGVITWHSKHGIGYEADPRHVEIINQQVLLQEAKAVSILGTKEEGRTTEDNEEPLSEEQATKYWALAARCNDLSLDRPDVAFAVKELARNMSKPRKGEWVRVTRLGRYLVGKPRLQQWFAWQGIPMGLGTYTDADWACCRETRKSTTGGVIMLGSHALKSWSKTQAFIALSSGESELYATLKASAQTLGLLAMLHDYGVKVSSEIWGDAQVALGIIHRKGQGKTRHVQTGLLWVQQLSAEKRLKFGKVWGKLYPADLFTKYFDQNTVEQHVARSNYAFAEGRASETPKLNNVSLSVDECGLFGKWERWEWLDVVYNHEQFHSERGDEQGARRPSGGEFHICGRVNNSQRMRSRGGACHTTIVNRNSSQSDLGQPVLQRFKRQVQGSNELNPAQPRRPWGSTQPFPSRHNEAQRLRQGGHAVIKAWGIAHIPGVVSREGRIRLPSEKGPYNKKWREQSQSLGQPGKNKAVTPEKD